MRCGTGRAAIIFMIYNNGNTYLHYRHPSSPRPGIFTIYSFFHCNTTAPGDGMRGWMEWGICSSSDQRLFIRIVSYHSPSQISYLYTNTHTRVHHHQISNCLLVFTPVYLLISASCPAWFLKIRILHFCFLNK